MKTPAQSEFARSSRRKFLKNFAFLTLASGSLGSLLASTAKAAGWDKNFQLAVDFEINRPGGARYHRPFVALWIEDSDGLAVRTLVLWVQKTGKGPRWIPDLKRWYRREKERRVLDGGDLAKTISSATRNSGKYRVVWDGKDDSGKLVAQGNYTVCLEAAREHGTYQLIKSDIVIGPRPFSKSLAGNIEIKSARLNYSKRG